VLQPGVNKKKFTKEEDAIVFEMATLQGGGNIQWSVIASQLRGRDSGQVRKRWLNQLDPTLIKTPWSEAETKRLIDFQALYGNQWTLFTKCFPGRSENSVKNRWNSAARRTLSGRYIPSAANIPADVAATLAGVDQTSLR
jgi:hypothetical protein